MVPLLLALLPSALGAPATFEQESRWRITNEVRLPAVMWLPAVRNSEARVTAWEVDMVFACSPAERAGRAFEVACQIDDFALDAAPYSADADILQPILDEVDRQLTGAAVDLRVSGDGRLLAVALEGQNERHRRHRALRENLRLIVSRAVAGLDLPRVPDELDGAMRQKGGWLFQMPASAGTLAGGYQLHQVVRGEDSAVQHSTGKATLEPFSERQIPVDISPTDGWDPSRTVGVLAQFSTQMDAAAVLDPTSGALIDREWFALGEPTPDSRMALGAEGYDYIQRGRAVRLKASESVALGTSDVLPPLEDEPSAFQVWETLGVLWR